MIAPNRRFDPLEEAPFLGAESLTWILWRAATDPRFVHPDGTEVWVHPDERLELRGERSAARRTALRGGVPASSLEVRAALRSGKSVASLRLLLARGEEERRVTLKADGPELGSVRLPAPEGESLEERAEGSLDLLSRLLSDIDLVFAAFRAAREGAGWDAEVARIREWALTPSEEERSGQG